MQITYNPQDTAPQDLAGGLGGQTDIYRQHLPAKSQVGGVWGGSWGRVEPDGGPHRLDEKGGGSWGGHVGELSPAGGRGSRGGVSERCLLGGVIFQRTYRTQSGIKSKSALRGAKGVGAGKDPSSELSLPPDTQADLATKTSAFRNKCVGDWPEAAATGGSAEGAGVGTTGTAAGAAPAASAAISSGLGGQAKDQFVVA